MMSQDELQEKVVNIEEHVIGMTTRQVAVYAWWIVAGAVMGTAFVLVTFFGIKAQFQEMNISMFKMEVRINKKIDSLSAIQTNIKTAPVTTVPTQQSPGTNYAYYIQKVVNGRTILIKVK